MYRNTLFVVSASLATLAAAAPGQAQQLVDRKLDRVAVVPSEDGKRGHYDLHVIHTVGFNETAAGLDTSTLVSVFVGGSSAPKKTMPVQFQLDFSAGICGFNGCSGGCGGGYIDGVFNNLLCLKESPSCPGNCDCTCQYPWITTTIPSVPLDPGAQVDVKLTALAGAFPETQTDNDTYSFVFDGQTSAWDRGVSSVKVKPTDGSDSKYDVEVAGFVGWAKLMKDADLGFELTLLVNGVPMGTQLIDGIAAPPGPGQESCGGSPSICDNGCGSWQGLPVSCDLMVTYPSYLISCSCGSGWITGFLAIPMNPNDDVEVVLTALPGALPSLPGSEGDNGGSTTIPAPCSGDLNGDGKVDGADLGLLLSDWGACAGCPGDLNGDNKVDGADLGLMLSAWGVCFPV